MTGVLIGTPVEPRCVCGHHDTDHTPVNDEQHAWCSACGCSYIEHDRQP